jgi:cyclophilin family peptidyl-prolyl cis-trans isomerase
MKLSVCFRMILVIATMTLLSACSTTTVPVKEGPTNVIIKTSKGDIKVELAEKEAPGTVKNFLAYVDSGHYKNLVFHRVMNGFMVQGGGFDTEFKQRPTNAPIRNEAGNGLKNKCGTLAMARTSDVHSAKAQFFINVVDNPFLDYKNSSQRGFGYCVFGRVVDGMDVVDLIKTVPTGNRGPYKNVPKENVMIYDIIRE